MLIICVFAVDLVNAFYSETHSLNNIYDISMAGFSVFNIIVISSIIFYFIITCLRGKLLLPKYVLLMLMLFILMISMGLVHMNISRQYLTDIQSIMFFICLFIISYNLVITKEQLFSLVNLFFY